MAKSGRLELGDNILGTL